MWGTHLCPSGEKYRFCESITDLLFNCYQFSWSNCHILLLRVQILPVINPEPVFCDSGDAWETNTFLQTRGRGNGGSGGGWVMARWGWGVRGLFVSGKPCRVLLGYRRTYPVCRPELWPGCLLQADKGVSAFLGDDMGEDPNRPM